MHTNTLIKYSNVPSFMLLMNYALFVGAKCLLVFHGNLDGAWYTTLSSLKTQQEYNVRKIEVLLTMGS